MSDEEVLAKYRLWMVLNGLTPIPIHHVSRCENCKPFVEHVRKGGGAVGYRCKYLCTQNLFDVSSDAGPCVRWVEYV